MQDLFLMAFPKKRVTFNSPYNPMTQKELVMAYVYEFGSILPAKIGGEVYKDHMFGSETSKRCRELRKEGKLTSKQAGKFEIFYKNNFVEGKILTLKDIHTAMATIGGKDFPVWKENKKEIKVEVKRDDLGI